MGIAKDGSSHFFWLNLNYHQKRWSLDLTTFKKLSNLEFRFGFRFDNFRKVVKSWV